MKPSSDHLLGSLLRRVSRSFHLTLRVLPGGLRAPVGLAYLLARAADTMADTPALAPGRRLDALLWLRGRVDGRRGGAMPAELEARQTNPDEKELLQSLEPALALFDALEGRDRKAVRDVVTTLTTGMEYDLLTFPDETSGRIAALATTADLDRYTYLIAGCVGEFWTAMSCTHVPALRGWDASAMSACGVRFGKALQLTNILRDCARDLRIGRCYLPQDMLSAAGLRPEDLQAPRNAARAQPVLEQVTRIALGHFREAARYTLALPRRCVRLRLACLWPVLIGLRTLDLLHADPAAWLEPERPLKVGRTAIYRMMTASLLAVPSNALVRRWIDREIARLERRLLCAQKKRGGAEPG